MATKITTAVFALIMGFSFSSFAGTPETKGEAKPETVTPPTTYTYHVTSENGDGTVNFASGPGPNCAGSSKLCEWQSSAPMVSPQDPDDIESDPSILQGTTKRRN